MKLIKFRIENFKSIIDTGYCTFASDLTILVGKNESGKTATLEALRYFNKNIQRVSEDAFPLDGSNREPLIEICFRLERKEIEAIQEDSGVRLSEGAVDYAVHDGVTVAKNSRGKYDLNEECAKQLFSKGGSHQPIKYIKSAKEKLQQVLHASQVPSIDFEASNEKIQKEAKELIKVVKNFLPSIKDEQMQAEAVEAVRTIIKESGKLTELPQPKEVEPKEQEKDSAVLFIESLVKHLPNFIFFTEFSDILPFEIPIGDLKNNQAVLDFAKIAGLDLDRFIETRDVQKRINFLNRHSATISGDFLEHWGQNKIELIVKPEGDKLLFGVKEQGKTDFYRVEQRSKGFQWFLSFYLRLNAQKSKNDFIIIDEPGTNLHAKAQREILKVFEDEIISESQVIFSTHCPYLIDPQRLDRIRLVLKDSQRGTVISDDIHGHTDEESMIPVMTAMGGEKTPTEPLLGKQNVILGETADFYFWKALKGYIKDLDLGEINMLFATDADKIVQLVSLMIGYNQEFQILLNHDDDGWQTGQRLKEKFGLEDKKIVFVSDTLGYATEDLFAPEDFRAHVLNSKEDKGWAVSNSVYLKNSKANRVLLAREFFDKVEKERDNVVLSDATIFSFRNVFEKILNGFHVPPEAHARQKGSERPEEEEEVEESPEPAIKRRSFFDFLKEK